MFCLGSGRRDVFILEGRTGDRQTDPLYPAMSLASVEEDGEELRMALFSRRGVRSSGCPSDWL